MSLGKKTGRSLTFCKGQAANSKIPNSKHQGIFKIQNTNLQYQPGMPLGFRILVFPWGWSFRPPISSVNLNS